MKLIVSAFCASLVCLTVQPVRAETRLPSSHEIQTALISLNEGYQNIVGEYKDCTDTVIGVSQLIATNASAELEIRKNVQGVQAKAKLGSGSEIDLTIDNGFVFSTKFSLIPSFGSGYSPTTIIRNVLNSDRINTTKSCMNTLWSKTKQGWSASGASQISQSLANITTEITTENMQQNLNFGKIASQTYDYGPIFIQDIKARSWIKLYPW